MLSICSQCHKPFQSEKYKQCDACRLYKREHARKAYQANPEKFCERGRIWRRTDPGHLAELIVKKTRVCEHCGIEFIKRGNYQKFCSTECQREDFIARPETKAYWKEKSKEAHSKHKDRRNAERRRRTAEDEEYRDRQRVFGRESYKRNMKRINVTDRLRSIKLKTEAMQGYCGELPKCTCECGCDESELLQLDFHHINGGGNKSKKETGIGKALYRWIINHNFPDDLQVICQRCHRRKNSYFFCKGAEFDYLGYFDLITAGN